MITGGAAALTVMTVAQVPQIFAAFLPPLAQCAAEPPASLERHRRGEVIAAVVSLAVGGAAAAIGRTPWPFLAAAGMTAWLVREYETGLHPSPALA